MHAKHLDSGQILLSVPAYEFYTSMKEITSQALDAREKPGFLAHEAAAWYHQRNC